MIYRGDHEEFEETCNKCEGLGKIIKFKCHECKGVGSVNKTMVEKISIPIGVGNEQILRKEGHVRIFMIGGNRKNVGRYWAKSWKKWGFVH